VWALNANEVRLIQIKCNGATLSDLDREAFELLPVPRGVRKELWTYPGGRAKLVITVIRDRSRR
jgi:hypothetical protein